MSEKDITYKEVISTLKDVKKFQPLKTNSWSSGDSIKTLFFAHSEGLVRTTDNGYVLTDKGEMLLKL